MGLLLSFILTLNIGTFAASNDQQNPEGVRVVGRGGGFAEMQAYAFDKTLPSLVRLCDQPGYTCPFLAEEKTLLSLITENEQELLNSLIQINTTCNAPYVHNAGSITSVDSCYLYQSESSEFGPVPKSFVEIGEIVLLVRLSTLKKELIDSQTIHNISRILLRETEFTHLPYAISVGQSLYRFNLWSVRMGLVSHSFLALENKETSYDLTNDFLKSLKCDKQVTQWNLEDVRVDYRPSQGHHVSGELKWVCGTQKFRALLAIDLVFQNETFKKADFYLLGKEAL